MFTWDGGKAERNLSKHGLSFDEATEAFADPQALDGPDLKHSGIETRRLLIGMTAGGRVVTIAYTRREADEGETTRIISARSASARERAAYFAP
jgi:uncharacterized protein